jgi:hypothetical protein
MHILLYISQALGLVALFSLIWLIIRAFKRHILWGIAVLLLSPFSALFFGIMYWTEEKKPFLAYMSSFTVATGLALYVFTTWGGWDVVHTALDVNEGIHSEKLTEQDALEFMHANLRYLKNASPNEEDRRNVEMMQKFLQQYEAGMSDADRKKMQEEIIIMMERDDLSEAQRRELKHLQKQLGLMENDSTAEKPAVTKPSLTRDTSSTLSRRPSSRKVNYRADYQEIEISEASKYVGKTFKVTRKNSQERQCRLIGSSPGRLRFEQRGRGGIFTFEFKHSEIEKLKVLASLD